MLHYAQIHACMLKNVVKSCFLIKNAILVSLDEGALHAKRNSLPSPELDFFHRVSLAAFISLNVLFCRLIS